MAKGGGFDMNKLMQQAQQMQEQMARVQDELANETVEASAGGGLVTVKATGAGEISEVKIDPKAVDPACGVEAKNCRVNGFEHLIIFDADRSKIIDVEKAPPINFITGRAPPSQPIVLPQQQGVKSLSPSRRRWIKCCNRVVVGLR